MKKRGEVTGVVAMIQSVLVLLDKLFMSDQQIDLPPASQHGFSWEEMGGAEGDCHMIMARPVRWRGGAVNTVTMIIHKKRKEVMEIVLSKGDPVEVECALKIEFEKIDLIKGEFEIIPKETGILHKGESSSPQSFEDVLTQCHLYDKIEVTFRKRTLPHIHIRRDASK